MDSREGTKTTDNATDEQVCAICWTEPENPVCLGCHHVYCLDCFEGLCTSENVTAFGYRIDCQGDMGKCERRVTLKELCEYLPSDAFEGVFESSFASYVRKRPNEFCYCPTPDCGFIYRTGTLLHTCTGCLEAVCTACHYQHGAMTCGEYKEIASGGYEAFEKFKKEMNIKDCPKCKTPTEKSYGCNHMTCGGCQAHICWVCMEVFTKGDEVYGHMTKAHGGLYTGEAVYENP